MCRGKRSAARSLRRITMCITNSWEMMEAAQILGILCNRTALMVLRNTQFGLLLVGNGSRGNVESDISVGTRLHNKDARRVKKGSMRRGDR